jgi:putative ABC transport system permease protein
MIIRVAFRALVRNKMRAALTMLGIIIGVSAVIAMVSIGQGASASVQAQIESIGTNLLFVSAGAQNVGGVRSGTGDSGTNTLTVEDLEAIKREVPSISMVTPSVNARSQLVAGNMNWNTSLQGVSEQYPEIRKWTVATGAFFTDADVRTSARVIVIGQSIADNLFPGMDAVGQTVRVANLPFRVVGVMAAKGQDPQGRDQDDTAFAPYTTVQKKVLGNTTVRIAYVSAVSQDATYTAQSQIGEQHDGRCRSGERNQQDDDDPAGVYRGCIAARRRHRHHEHHAGVRHRTHPRDRHSHGDWSTVFGSA